MAKEADYSCSIRIQPSHFSIIANRSARSRVAGRTTQRDYLGSILEQWDRLCEVADRHQLDPFALVEVMIAHGAAIAGTIEEIREMKRADDGER